MFWVLRKERRKSNRRNYGNTTSSRQHSPTMDQLRTPCLNPPEPSANGGFNPSFNRISFVTRHSSSPFRLRIIEPPNRSTWLTRRRLPRWNWDSIRRSGPIRVVVHNLHPSSSYSTLVVWVCPEILVCRCFLPSSRPIVIVVPHDHEREICFDFTWFNFIIVHFIDYIDLRRYYPYYKSWLCWRRGIDSEVNVKVMF